MTGVVVEVNAAAKENVCWLEAVDKKLMQFLKDGPLEVQIIAHGSTMMAVTILRYSLSFIHVLQNQRGLGLTSTLI